MELTFSQHARDTHDMFDMYDHTKHADVGVVVAREVVPPSLIGDH
jgi:hypothetical protein